MYLEKGRRFMGILCLLALAALVAAGCAGGGARQSTPTPASGFTEQSGVVEVKCPFYLRPNQNVSCGKLEVPEDYAQLDGRTIELLVVVVHSTSSNPERDPILLLPGDAGVSMLDSIFYIAQFFSVFLDQRDVVYYDPRGLGQSGGALECPEFIEWHYRSMLEKATLETEYSWLEPGLQACRERLLNAEINPNVYTAAAMAADLNTLRLALGYSQFNLMAGGFGVDLALTLMRDYPQTVRSAVLVDLEFPLGYTNLGVFARSAQHSLDLLFTRCAEDTECRQAYPELENHFYSVVDELNLKPVQVDVLLPGVSSVSKVTVAGTDFINLALTMLSTTQTIENLPKLVEEVYQGRALKMSEYIQRYYIALPDEYYVGVELNHICSELHGAFWEDSSLGADVQPVISQAVQESWAFYQPLCAQWNGTGRLASAAKPISSDTPMLVMQGEFHPFYAPAQVEEIFWGIPNVNHVVISNLSNDVFGGESCAGNLVVEWLASPGDRLDTSCASQTAPLEFLMPDK